MGLLKGSEVGDTGSRSITTLMIEESLEERPADLSYPRLSAVSKIRRWVDSEMPFLRLRAMETVPTDMPLASAISRTVTFRLTELIVDLHRHRGLSATGSPVRHRRPWCTERYECVVGQQPSAAAGAV